MSILAWLSTDHAAEARADRSATQLVRAELPWLTELLAIYALLTLALAATTGLSDAATLSPHPFWIPVLLLAFQHGTPAGIAAAVAATALHWLTGKPVPAGSEDMYDYLHRVWREPMLWLAASILLGGFRAQQLLKLEAMRQRLVEAEHRLSSIGTLADRLTGHCQHLERQMACAAERSVDAGIAALEEVRAAAYEDLPDVLPAAVEILLGPASYLVLAQREGRLVAVPELGRVLEAVPQPVRPGSLPDTLEMDLVRGRRLLSIRHAGDVARLGGDGMLAAPILSEAGDRTLGAMVIVALDPGRITAATERNLVALCRELGHVLARQRVVVSFQRERAAPRVAGSEEPHAAEPVRSARDGRRGSPD